MSIKKLFHTIIFIFLGLCFCNINPFILSDAADSISANQTLSGDQTIISSGGNFELGFMGFYSPGEFFRRYYICIWYKKVEERNVVWVANRESPISDHNSAQLKISDGNLELFDMFRTRIWSTGLHSKNPAATTSNSVIALLLDNGNLVLRDGSNSNLSKSTDFSENLWESFDNPTHTFMPGAKIGYDKRTQKKIRLTSWKNSEDPSPGPFTLEIDTNNNQFVIMRNGFMKYWVSGTWNGHTFSLVPEMRLNYIYNYSYVDTENQTYFTYSLYSQSIVSRAILDVSGMIKMFSWDGESGYWTLFWAQPREQCEVYGYCGAFGLCDQNQLPLCVCLPGFKKKSRSIDYYQFVKDDDFECVREFSLPCENNNVIRKDTFLRKTNLSLPEDSQQLAGLSKEDCESVCLNNCSCTAYAYDEKGCHIWNGELWNIRKLLKRYNNGKTIYIRLSANSSSVFHGTKNVPKGVIAGSVVAVFVLSALIWVIVVFTRRRKKVRTSKAVEGFLVAFGYKDLQNATKNFSTKLGGGGFGSVFKGTLPDSTVVAVKKLESISQGEKQFRAEVSTIGIIQHVNLVRLRGFCVQGNKKMLVYDYMENGSLDSHLFKNSKVLKWKIRYQIALGLARGLAYLHENCRDCIIHCDIKPENVLLDAEFCPKVADFGLAKLVGHDFSRALTTMRGTLGYLAPEWISGVAITAKADVYSYGMMLFELVSGKRNWTRSEDENVRYFPCLAASVTIEGGDVLDLLDPVLKGDADEEEVKRICKVGCWCVQVDESIRPSMSQIVQILEGIIDVNMPPVPRWLQVLVDETPETSSTN